MQEALIDSHHWYYSCRAGNGRCDIEFCGTSLDAAGGFVANFRFLFWLSQSEIPLVLSDIRAFV